ncbi:MAG: hypothetical protein IPN70_02955 [Candidatus Moraniibacteriota bacterium]|nr:MAG: hypothetical protein IPN70_02955 [Candidatus Moranbacteria bacterium]
MSRKREQMLNHYESVVVSGMMKDALETSVEIIVSQDMPKKTKMKWYKKLLKKVGTKFATIRK